MKYWVNSSDEDYDAMQVMYKNKKNTWTLFLGHLVIEKLLKGLYAKKNEENPYTIKSHNLLFGSYAKGTNHEDSDIDVAVVLDSNNDIIDLMVELMMYTQDIDLRIEPI